MHISELFEARKNPEQNPKVSINQHLNAAYEKYGDRAFVSFTKLDKLGINPKSPHNTPLGIYAYPLGYVVDEMGDDAPASETVPYAGAAPFATIFLGKGHIINFDKLTGSQIKRYVQQIVEMFPDAANMSQPTTPNGFWYFSFKVSELMSDRSPTNTTHPVVWNALFRKLGIDGFVDNGNGIIHNNEPTQAVFFHIGAIELIDRVQNKHSPDAVGGSITAGDRRKDIVDIVYQHKDKIRQIRSLDDIGQFLNTIKQSVSYWDNNISTIVITSMYNYLTQEGRDVVAEYYYAILPYIRNIPVEVMAKAMFAATAGSSTSPLRALAISNYSEQYITKMFQLMYKQDPDLANEAASEFAYSAYSTDIEDDVVGQKYSIEFKRFINQLAGTSY